MVRFMRPNHMGLIKLLILYFVYPRSTTKRDSAQSSSNKCKEYLLKVYPKCSTFLNITQNISLQFSSLGEPQLILNPKAFSRNLMSNLIRMLKAYAIVFSPNAQRSFCLILLKLINYSCSSYPTSASYSGQVDGFRNPMKTELKTRPCLKAVFQII